MKKNPPYMPWLDRLPEVGTPLLDKRDELARKLDEARALEAQAAALRDSVKEGRAELLARLMTTWSLAEIQAAYDRTESQLYPVPLATVNDAELRACISAHEGQASMHDALNLFGTQVVRQHNLLSTATDTERRATLARALDWWNLMVVPLLDAAPTMPKESPLAA